MSGKQKPAVFIPLIYAENASHRNILTVYLRNIYQNMLDIRTILYYNKEK